MKNEESMDALERVREARHRISEQFDHDPKRLVEYYIEQQQHYKDRLVEASASEDQDDRSEKAA